VCFNEKQAGRAALRDVRPGWTRPRTQLRGARQRAVECRSWPCHDRKIRKVEDAGKFVPCGNFCKRVSSEDEEKLRRLPSGGVQTPKRIRRIGVALSQQFHIGHAVRRTGVRGERHHRKPVKTARMRIDRAVRWIVGGDEQDVGQCQRRACRVHCVEMTEVNRVERAAEHTETGHARRDAGSSWSRVGAMPDWFEAAADCAVPSCRHVAASS